MRCSTQTGNWVFVNVTVTNQNIINRRQTEVPLWRSTSHYLIFLMHQQPCWSYRSPNICGVFVLTMMQIFNVILNHKPPANFSHYVLVLTSSDRALIRQLKSTVPWLSSSTRCRNTTEFVVNRVTANKLVRLTDLTVAQQSL